MITTRVELSEIMIVCGEVCSIVIKNISFPSNTLSTDTEILNEAFAIPAGIVIERSMAELISVPPKTINHVIYQLKYIIIIWSRLPVALMPVVLSVTITSVNNNLLSTSTG